MSRLKKRLFEILELRDSGDKTSRIIGLLIIALVSLNVLAVILSTEEKFSNRYKDILNLFEMFSVIIFTIEYILRLWCCNTHPEFKGKISGRIRFMLTPFSLIDIAALLPFYLPLVVGLDLRFVRVLRLMRIFRILKVSRYNSAFYTLSSIIRKKKEELVITTFGVVTLLIFTSSIMYLVEHKAQPEAFSSIPAAMWWGVVTLTTVGYGDIYPVTVVGKVCASVIAILSVGLFALPAGIFASGFTEAIKKEEKRKKCPHCGEILDDEFTSNV